MQDETDTDEIARLRESLVALNLSIDDDRWARAARLLSMVDAIGRDRGVALVKIDGYRESNVYTVVLCGGRLGEEGFRKDGTDLETLLVEALQFYTRTALNLARRG